MSYPSAAAAVVDGFEEVRGSWKFAEEVVGEAVVAAAVGLAACCGGE